MDGPDIDHGRRAFLTGRNPARLPEGIRPPWTRTASVEASCTGCGACVPACPRGIVALDQAHLPALSFSTSECSFCGACARACVEPVFDLALAPFLHVVTIGQSCFATSGIVCESCGDACPESAIRFRARLGGPAVPELVADRCTGCGSCIAACPSRAIAARPRTSEAVHA